MLGRPMSRVAHGATILLALVASSCTCDGGGVADQQAILRSSLGADPTGKADFLIDFGPVAVGDRKVQGEDFANDGNMILVVAGENPQIPFTSEIPMSGLSIAVGARERLTFGFEPREETAGPVEIILEITTNEPGGKSYTVRLVGRGLHAFLSCTPATLDFGDVPKGLRRELSTSCTNSLPFPIEYEARRVRGNYNQFFSAITRGSTSGWTKVQQGETVTIDVSFDSQALGKNEAVLELTSSLGQAVAELPLDANSVNSGLVVEPETCLDFSYVGVGQSEERPLLLRNTGATSLRITAMDVTGGDTASFSIVDPLPSSLGPGASAELTIEYRPASGGPHLAQLLFQTDEPGGSAVTGCVKGFGGGPAISCTRSSIDFGMVAVGMPVRASYQCMNSGVAAPGGSAVDPLQIQGLRSSASVFSARIINEDRSEGPSRSGYRMGDGFQVEVLYSPEAERFDSGVISIDTTSAPGGSLDTLVSGQGRDLPPCDFSVEPPTLRFGIVDRGKERVREFTIQNHLETSCLINGLQLEDGSGPAFSMEPIPSLELFGNEILEIPVTFAPNSFGTFEGAVVFQISAPADPEHRLPLQGISATPCLKIEPAVLDFGAVSPQCQTHEVWLSVTNICGIPQTINRIGVEEGPASDAFQIVQRAALPKTLHPRERSEITLVFRPSRLGHHSAAIEVEVEGSESYFSRLIGASDENPLQIDTFDQTPSPKVDILWVMDNSGSFSTYQNAISQNLPAFLATAKEQRVDYRIAVTTSGLDPSRSACPGGASGGEDGRFFPIDGSHPRVLTPTTPDLERHWAHNMKVGICHADELHFEAAKRALSEPLIHETKSSNPRHSSSPWNDGNAGFLRREASLSIIFVADEKEQSSDTVPNYLTFFERLKAKDTLRIHGITGGVTGGTASGAGRATCNHTGARYLEIIEASEGTWLDICTPTNDAAAWTAGLASMSEGAFGFRDRFILRGTPGDRNGDGKVNEDDIILMVNGRSEPQLNEGTRQPRWVYDPVARSINFTPLFIPRAGAQITAEYQVACLSG